MTGKAGAENTEKTIQNLVHDIKKIYIENQRSYPPPHKRWGGGRARRSEKKKKKKEGAPPQSKGVWGG